MSTGSIECGVSQEVLSLERQSSPYLETHFMASWIGMLWLILTERSILSRHQIDVGDNRMRTPILSHCEGNC